MFNDFFLILTGSTIFFRQVLQIHHLLKINVRNMSYLCVRHSREPVIFDFEFITLFSGLISSSLEDVTKAHNIFRLFGSYNSAVILIFRD